MLFEPLKIRDVSLRNRVVVSPMCQYSAKDGFVGDWHLVHLGKFAQGGAGAVFVEALPRLPGGKMFWIFSLVFCDTHWLILSLASSAPILKSA